MTRTSYLIGSFKYPAQRLGVNGRARTESRSRESDALPTGKVLNPTTERPRQALSPPIRMYDYMMPKNRNGLLISANPTGLTGAIAASNYISNYHSQTGILPSYFTFKWKMWGFSD